MNISDSLKIFKIGTVIMRQGEMGHTAYLIDKGKVQIEMEHKDGSVSVIATRGPGTMIGEMSLVDNAPRSATVRAIEDCNLIEISKEDFSRRLEASDPVVRMTTQVILTRLRDVLVRADIKVKNNTWPTAEDIEQSLAQSSNAVESIRLANEFNHALKNNKISLYYQPLVNVQSGEIEGFEALMRWIHPEKGFISPGVFIPVIEDSGLIVEASKFAAKEACLALKRIETATNKKNLHVSVNFSSADFSESSFTDTIFKAIENAQIKESQLHLEITERILIQQPEKAKETLSLCKKRGLGISIDDFGTGYSSLSYLHYFPINTLKIDQSFIREMLKHEDTMALVRSIIAMAKNLKMSIIAEGVEYQEEAASLREMGCDALQGYYFAKPMPEEALIEFLKNGTLNKI